MPGLKRGISFTCAGDIQQPLLFGLLVILLLVLRIPPIAHGIKKLRASLVCQAQLVQQRAGFTAQQCANRVESGAPRWP